MSTSEHLLPFCRRVLISYRTSLSHIRHASSSPFDALSKCSFASTARTAKFHLRTASYTALEAVHGSGGRHPRI